MYNTGGLPTPTGTPDSSHGRANTYRSNHGVSDASRLVEVSSVKLEDLAPGDICWLTAQELMAQGIMCTSNHICNDVYLRGEAYRHPMVIVSLRQRPGSTTPGDVLARFCMVSTSLNLHLLLPPNYLVVVVLRIFH